MRCFKGLTLFPAEQGSGALFQVLRLLKISFSSYVRCAFIPCRLKPVLVIGSRYPTESSTIKETPMNIEKANAEATERMIEARAVLVGSSAGPERSDRTAQSRRRPRGDKLPGGRRLRSSLRFLPAGEPKRLGCLSIIFSLKHNLTRDDLMKEHRMMTFPLRF